MRIILDFMYWFDVPIEQITITIRVRSSPDSHRNHDGAGFLLASREVKPRVPTRRVDIS